MGYMPEFVNDGLLLGTFQVDDMHNKVHIISGVAALVGAFSSLLARSFFIIFGLLYGIAAVLGFQSGEIYGMQVNMNDNYLHAGIAAIALLLGLNTTLNHPAMAACINDKMRPSLKTFYLKKLRNRSDTSATSSSVVNRPNENLTELFACSSENPIARST